MQSNRLAVLIPINTIGSIEIKSAISAEIRTLNGMVFYLSETEDRIRQELNPVTEHPSNPFEEQLRAPDFDWSGHPGPNSSQMADSKFESIPPGAFNPNFHHPR